MKRKLYAGGILILALALITLAVLFFFNQKTEVSASSKVFVNQPYIVYFSEPIHSNSIEEKAVYITKENGEKVDAYLTFQQNQQSIMIEGLHTGNYILHIEEAAFKDTFIKNKKRELPFEVIEKMEEVKSIQELKDYFEAILNTSNFYAVEESEEKSSVALDSKGADAATSYSTTNNQVENIEEGDSVITDGKYIYSIVDNEIIITDASNPKSLKVVNRITFDTQSYPTKLIIHEDMLIAIFETYEEREKDRYISMTNAAFYNITDGTKPTLVREVGQEGYINGVRKYDDVLYLITNSAPDYWIMEEKEDIELRPFIYDSKESKEVNPLDINKITILPGSNEADYTIISAIDLSNFESSSFETKGYLGGSSSLYMSNEALYLTAIKHAPIDFKSDDIMDDDSASKKDMRILPVNSEVNTDIYKYAIDGTKIEFVATTSIKGSILNQFSMDEHDGHFRIAITEGSVWNNTEELSKNHLYIYDGKLQKVGEVTNLAEGEKIYSVRFMGDKAYIVTFKEVDPLFVLSLENPEKPKVLGELKIPGFSNYLHPLDETHLIGIGYDTESLIDEYTKQPIIRTKGIKISLFDVEDLSNPKEQDSEVIGGRGTYSEVEYDHKALFRNSEYNYYGFPITVYEEKGKDEVQYKGTGAVIYEITAEEGIKLKGELIVPAKKGEQYEEWDNVITRLLYIENTLYTVSRKEIKSYNLKNLEFLNNVIIR